MKRGFFSKIPQQNTRKTQKTSRQIKCLFQYHSQDQDFENQKLQQLPNSVKKNKNPTTKYIKNQKN